MFISIYSKKKKNLAKVKVLFKLTQHFSQTFHTYSN